LSSASFRSPQPSRMHSTTGRGRWGIVGMTWRG
jgi:hypothetical protein